MYRLVLPGRSLGGGDIGTRKVGFVVCLGRRWVGLWRRKVLLGRRDDVGTRKVRFVAVVGPALLGIRALRNGSISGRNAGLWGRRGATGRGRWEVLGKRKNRGPLVRRWSLRECESSRKADKNDCRNDFQLHIVSLL